MQKRRQQFVLEGATGQFLSGFALSHFKKKKNVLFLLPRLGKSFVRQPQTCQVSLIWNVFQGKLFGLFFFF
jgi:hypothetical protein